MKDEKDYAHTIEISRPTGPRVLPPIAGESRGYLAKYNPLPAVASFSARALAVARRPRVIAVGSTLALALATHLFVASLSNGFSYLTTQASILLTGAGTARTVTSYAGPADVVASPVMYWGLRCKDTAYTGNVADVYAPSDASHTLITCSSGGVLNETLQALSVTCATSCSIKTLYDQVGTGCSGSACDLVNATEAARPKYTLNCFGTKPCMTFLGSSSQLLANTGSLTTVNQPITVSTVARRTSTTTENEILGSAAIGLGFNNSANQAFIFAAGLLTASATDSVLHAFQFILDGGSSNIVVDATATGGSLGGSTLNGYIRMGTNSTQYLTGNITEMGIWASAFNGTQQTNMCNNQYGYWGTGVSC